MLIMCKKFRDDNFFNMIVKSNMVVLNIQGFKILGPFFGLYTGIK